MRYAFLKSFDTILFERKDPRMTRNHPNINEKIPRNSNFKQFYAVFDKFSIEFVN